jgi:DNA-binding NtrC family response regulator
MSPNGAAQILVVDDDPAVVRSVGALIELETPHRVVGETAPQRAIERAKLSPFDMVISDFLMPHIDGIGLLLEIRRLCPETSLVLLTGYADKEAAIRAINEVGIFQYMHKPWENDDVLSIVASGLDKRLQLLRMHERVRELELQLQYLHEENLALEARLRQLGRRR